MNRAGFFYGFADLTLHLPFTINLGDVASLIHQQISFKPVKS